MPRTKDAKGSYFGLGTKLSMDDITGGIGAKIKTGTVFCRNGILLFCEFKEQTKCWDCIGTLPLGGLGLKAIVKQTEKLSTGDMLRQQKLGTWHCCWRVHPFSPGLPQAMRSELVGSQPAPPPEQPVLLPLPPPPPPPPPATTTTTTTCSNNMQQQQQQQQEQGLIYKGGGFGALGGALRFSWINHHYLSITKLLLMIILINHFLSGLATGIRASASQVIWWDTSSLL